MTFLSSLTSRARFRLPFSFASLVMYSMRALGEQSGTIWECCLVLELRPPTTPPVERQSGVVTPEVADAFAHERSETAIREQRLRDAIGARTWPLVGESAEKRATRDRQAG